MNEIETQEDELITPHTESLLTETHNTPLKESLLKSVLFAPH